ncbi:MAG: hypothetical protein O7D30_12720, partial [Rickettsia endosymbiont of Ixodes persulcatus]|nr:hypothetical protein [Rickettsia endosymbiont of Ixodes persulcatus]
GRIFEMMSIIDKEPSAVLLIHSLILSRDSQLLDRHTAACCCRRRRSLLHSRRVLFFRFWNKFAPFKSLVFPVLSCLLLRHS